jgi:1-phosphofructokinase family hexose kinase
VALGFAAGHTGQVMVQMLEQRGAMCDFVWAEGETRTNYVLIDADAARQATITVPGLRVQSDHLASLREKLQDHLPRACCLVLGGSLPNGALPELYAELISLATEADVPTLFDASGPGLQAGASALPSLLKPNRNEMEQLCGQSLPTVRCLSEAAREWVARGVERVVITAGQQGAWAFSASEECFVPALELEPLNTAGAGDALMAGLAVGFAGQCSWTEALRLGAAAAAAVCLTPGTADCHREDVERLLSQVEIFPV